MLLSFQAEHAWTCGPAVVRDLLVFYDRPAPRESDLAEALNTNTKTGTHPERIVKWLERHGFDVRWGERGTLETIRHALSQNHPIIMLSVSWGGHYTLVVGEERERWRDSGGAFILADPAAADEGKTDGFRMICGARLKAEWFDRDFSTNGLFIIGVPHHG